MYAVFSACGKQYKVKKGDTLQLDLLADKLGDTVSFTDVLVAGEGEGIQIGKPFVDKALVKAEVLGVEKGPKIDIVMYKRRKQFKRHIGHRQPYTRVLITEVSVGGKADSLSKDERETILKNVGFNQADEFSAVALDEAAQARKAEKLKARVAKQKAKAAAPKAPAKKASGKKGGAKKSTAKAKAPAKKAAKTSE